MPKYLFSIVFILASVSGSKSHANMIIDTKTGVTDIAKVPEFDEYKLGFTFYLKQAAKLGRVRIFTKHMDTNLPINGTTGKIVGLDSLPKWGTDLNVYFPVNEKDRTINVEIYDDNNKVISSAKIDADDLAFKKGNELGLPGQRIFQVRNSEGILFWRLSGKMPPTDTNKSKLADLLKMKSDVSEQLRLDVERLVKMTDKEILSLHENKILPGEFSESIKSFNPGDKFLDFKKFPNYQKSKMKLTDESLEKLLRASDKELQRALATK